MYIKHLQTHCQNLVISCIRNNNPVRADEIINMIITHYPAVNIIALFRLFQKRAQLFIAVSLYWRVINFYCSHFEWLYIKRK